MADDERLPALVQVFGRLPVAGRTKTRLIPRLGAHGAARWHARALAHVLANARGAGSAERPVTREFWYDGDDAPALAALRDRDPELACHPQVDGDLGERMAAALRAGLARARAVVLVGTDCPLFEADDLRAAFAGLEAGADLVLGPVEDGGYVAIGVRRFDACLFEDIPWSTDRVLARTLEAAARLGWRVALLPLHRDVDTPADLDRLHVEAERFAAWIG